MFIMQGYASSFDSFLKCTDQKEVFLDSFTAHIKKLKVDSLLDIGAGSGDPAVRLSRLVQDYVAIDRNEIFIKRLQSHNLEAIKADFIKDDVRLKRKFDLVLCSFVIPHDENFEVFVNRAWNHVASGGHLLIVTQPDSDTEWAKFCQKINHKALWTYPNFIPLLLRHLGTLGSVSMKEVRTSVASGNYDDFFSALAFVASAGVTEIANSFYKNKGEIKRVIEKDYLKNGKYSFPFTNLFILCKKSH